MHEGRRHSDIINKLFGQKGERIRGIQGFVTDDGRFLDRLEAAKEALETKQISELEHPPRLYSEDLW